MDVLLGVGNDANGDDGIGPWIARHFSKKGWQSIDCFTVPENYTGEVKRLQPKHVVIIDAADMDLSPGAIRIIPQDHIGKATFSTHAMPLSVFIDYVQETTEAAVTLIGIQPCSFEEMSQDVTLAGEWLLQILQSGRIMELPRL